MAIWHVNESTAASGGPAVGQFRLSGYVFDAQGTQHVAYIGVDSHVHELWWNTSGWHHLASRRPTGEIGQGASAPPLPSISHHYYDNERDKGLQIFRAFGHEVDHAPVLMGAQTSSGLIRGRKI